MSGKVNFLEKSAFVLTYKKMVILMGIWFVFCLFILLIEGSYSWYLGKSIARGRKTMMALNAKKERTMALVEASKSASIIPDVRELSAIYSHFPVWSKIMASLSKSMPSQIYLTSVSSEYLGNESMNRKVELQGVGQSASTTAGFVQQLNEKPMFYNMVLNKSERITDENQKSGYSFVVIGEVHFTEKEWD